MTAGELFENALIHWREAKCVGTFHIPAPLNDKVMLLGALQGMYAKNPNISVLVICNSFGERSNIIDFLTSDVDEDNNEEFKNLIINKTLKIYSTQYIDSIKGRTSCSVIILYNVFYKSEYVITLLKNTKFKLVIFNKFPKDNEYYYSVCKEAPMLSDFGPNEVNEVRLSTPVEESRIGVDIDINSETGRLLTYYNNYIATSLNIFGSLDVMKQCTLGNDKLNISAAQMCDTIARENGWNEHLDMSSSLNIQLDDLYNPGNLRDRAKLTYETIRNRSILLSDCKQKLQEIFNIVNDNENNILIISKRGEFAAEITAYLNAACGKDICGDYHDKVNPIPAVDDDGNLLYYKSGVNKGKLRTMGSQAQKTYNEKRYNSGKLKVLSASNMPDKELCCNVSTIIITSPMCATIEEYIYRLNNVSYPDGKIKLYSLYVKNSMELSRLQNKPISETHTIVKNCEQEVTTENNYDFIVVD